jgi:hypothetical protein
MVSRLLLTVAARVRFQVKSCGICGGQSGTGPGFVRVLRFPLTIFIPPTASYSSTIPVAGTTGRIVVDLQNGLTPTHEIGEKYICLATDRVLGWYSLIPFRLNLFVKRKLDLEMEINICTYFIYTVMARKTVCFNTSCY